MSEKNSLEKRVKNIILTAGIAAVAFTSLSSCPRQYRPDYLKNLDIGEKVGYNSEKSVEKDHYKPLEDQNK